MWGESSLNNYWWTYISDYRTSGRRRTNPTADSFYFPSRLLTQDVRSALHIDKAKLWTPAYGLILSFPGKMATKNKTYGLLPGLLRFQGHQTSDVRVALWTGLFQEVASRKSWPIAHLWTRTSKKASQLPKFWICMKSSWDITSQSPTADTASLARSTLCLSALPEHGQSKGRQ